MKLISRAFFRFASLLLFVVVAGCGAGTLNLKYEALPGANNLLTSVPPVKIKVLSFADKREGGPEPTLVGGIQRNIAGPIFDVRSERPVAEVVMEALKSELVRSGHKIVDSGEEIVIKGEIRTFWLKTEPNPEYVEITGETAVLLEVVNSDNGNSTYLGPYSAKNKETRFISSDDSRVSERILGKSLSLLIQQISSDAKLASALGKK